MDTPGIARGLYEFWRSGLQSSIRPVFAASMSAGPDGIREINAQSEDRAHGPDNASGLVDPGFPFLPSLLHYPRNIV